MASFDNVVTPYLLPKGTYKRNTSEPLTDSVDAEASTSFGWMPASPPFRNVSLQLKALSNDSNVAADACTTLPHDTPNLSGYAVLIRLGGCDATMKVAHAVARNADNVVFYADDNSG